MMATMGNGSNYLNFAQQGVQMELNAALRSLATNQTPIKTQVYHRRSSANMKFSTPPDSYKASENLSKSLPKGSSTRNSPSRLSPSQMHHDFYAGAKFGDRPSPQELPKPPQQWMSENQLRESKEMSCLEMTNSLKLLLKVQS